MLVMNTADDLPIGSSDSLFNQNDQVTAQNKTSSTQFTATRIKSINLPALIFACTTIDCDTPIDTIDSSTEDSIDSCVSLVSCTLNDTNFDDHVVDDETPTEYSSPVNCCSTMKFTASTSTSSICSSFLGNNLLYLNNIDSRQAESKKSLLFVLF